MARPSFTGYPFTLGVASGSPSCRGLVLWTRLAPEPLNGGGVGARTVGVDWELAEDEQFAKVVRHGTVVARPAWAHSVHVEVDGLVPGRWYFYRFTAGDEVSPVGRTRTAPDPQDAAPRLRLGLGSCQHFEQGYYAGHRHLAEEDLDLMVFVGDYIYEDRARADRVRRHVGAEARTLVAYRNRHAQYKTDPDLQHLHGSVPWLLTWDDHEVDNNYAALRSESLDRDFKRRRAAAYRAYFEHMPLPERARPTNARMVLRSRHDWGRLARFHLLDGRQHRTPQACPRKGRGGGRMIGEGCRELHSAGRTMLGARQEQWLADGLRAAPDRWNVIAQQTLMAGAQVIVGGRPRFSSDAWDGYPAARARLLGSIAELAPGSCLVLSGDAHTAFVSDLKRSFGDVDSATIATEICATSLTSRGRAQSATDRIVRDNPHIHYGESRKRGYVVLDIAPARCDVALRVLDDVTERDTGVTTAASFAIDAGKPGARRLDSEA